MSSNSELISLIIAFLRSIDRPIAATVLEGHTFMPGVSIGGGALLYDERNLTYPGDLLHEAGHMAVLTPEARLACNGDAGGDAGAEMAAIAWSFAAAKAIGLDARVVFHADGYGKGGHSVAANFEAGNYVGVPLLAWFGMTEDPRGKPDTGAEGVYPRMTHWLRQADDRF